MRFLAIDLGDRRTGLASGDDQVGLVSPLRVLEIASREALIDAIVEVVTDVEPHEIVVGLPLNMDDTEGPAAKQARAFADAVHERTSLVVHLQDERLTSYAADQRMARTGRTHQEKKRLRDALAAAEILQDFLDSRA